MMSNSKYRRCLYPSTWFPYPQVKMFPFSTYVERNIDLGWLRNFKYFPLYQNYIILSRSYRYLINILYITFTIFSKLVRLDFYFDGIFYKGPQESNDGVV